MWFGKKKKEAPEKKPVVKDDSMSKIIDEVLSEQAAAKEAAMRETAQSSTPEESACEAAAAVAKEVGNPHITKLIEDFYENQNSDTFKTVLDALLTSVMLVPMAPVPNDNSDKKNVQFRPGLVTNQDGEKFFPVFSEKTQIPEDYGKNFSMVAIPFPSCCDLATKIPECGKIIVNPFTKQFIVNSNIANAIAQGNQKQNEKKGAMIEFSTPEPETAPLVESVVKWFEKTSEIKKAYFSKMKNQDKISYVFIIDCDNHQELFPQLIEHIKSSKIEMPVTLMLYSQLKKIADESKHINQIYSK